MTSDEMKISPRLTSFHCTYSSNTWNRSGEFWSKACLVQKIRSFCQEWTELVDKAAWDCFVD